MENFGLFWTDTPWNKFVKDLSPFIEEILEQNNGLVIRTWEVESYTSTLEDCGFVLSVPVFFF